MKTSLSPIVQTKMDFHGFRYSTAVMQINEVVVGFYYHQKCLVKDILL